MRFFMEKCQARIHWGKAGWDWLQPCFDGAAHYSTWCDFGCAVQVQLLIQPHLQCMGSLFCPEFWCTRVLHWSIAVVQDAAAQCLWDVRELDPISKFTGISNAWCDAPQTKMLICL